jgi:hypothetical protein
LNTLKGTPSSWHFLPETTRERVCLGHHILIYIAIRAGERKTTDLQSGMRWVARHIVSKKIIFLGFANEEGSHHGVNVQKQLAKQQVP